MARAVERALRERRYLVAEAGTGTGKTLAYLVPAALSGRRVIVSTATKTLQEQIWGKDIPLLRERCGLDFAAAYLKGRSNYYCLARGAEFARAPTFAAREEAALWPVIEAWSRTTETGDRSELDLPDQLHTWKDLSATAETCTGRECERYEDCFVTQARALAGQSDVLLVNHHLFFADLAMRTSRAGVEILPDYDVVIFDEAHALEEVATEYFGLQVSSYRVDELGRDALRAVGDRPDLASMMRDATGELRRAGERFFQAVADGLRAGGGGAGPQRGFGARGAPRGRTPRRGQEEESVRAPLVEELLAPCERDQARLDAALEALRELLAEAEAPQLAQIARRAGELRVELAAVTAMKEPSRVYFAEVRGRGVFLRAAPIDVAEELQARLYRRTDTVVFTSATLAAQGRFDYFRRQVGLAPEFDVDEARYPGPFDFPRQAAIVSPAAVPEPNAPGFLEAAAGAIRALTAVTDGRAFVLCTSNRNMVALHSALRDLPYQVLLQGERPKARLLEAFRAEPSVLFATASFWEGVDVPGDALSLVVIDRLPFAPPGDPVVAARLRALEAEGRDGFSELSVPAAALALRQGFGRLVRTRDDRGLVAILDRRLVTKGYGRAFLATLPKSPLLRSVEEARAWWQRGGVAPAPHRA
ncbi:ATP-dependent DNA helicase [Anaeromyxobacter sp. SG64]|uniref:ATP-dependent DNA helicase n=1 Tax=Anaeromyxobacter sp. SG64 TaxID=2925409 RepID=UPI001F580829|nr:helicase C-terminal domain-containing protein [Anaeromyxobacter sp. SG64]